MKSPLSKISLLVLMLSGVYSYTVTGQIITTIAGGAIGHGGYWGDGGPATAAETGYFGGIATNSNCDVYISDGSNHRIRRIDKATGIINTIAGTGIAGYNGDGIIPTAAKLSYPGWISIDNADNLYVADAYNNRMRKVNADASNIATVAGNGVFGTTGDGGLATSAEINGGGGGVMDNAGNIYIMEVRKIRKIAPSGIITTIAGTGNSGVTGEGVPATSTPIIPQGGIDVDSDGNVYFADSTRSVRKITISTGIINRIAGTGDYISTPYSGDGVQATACHIGPLGIKVDDSGNVFIADMSNSRVEKVSVLTGKISTIAGNGSIGFGGDEGSAISATLSSPQGVTVDKSGNVYIADFGNKRVRKVTYHEDCDATTRVSAAKEVANTSIYPNPTSTTLTLTSSEKINTLSITNSIGQMIHHQQYIGKEQVEVNVAHLPQGIYTLKINGTHVRRFLKN